MRVCGLSNGQRQEEFATGMKLLSVSDVPNVQEVCRKSYYYTFTVQRLCFFIFENVTNITRHCLGITVHEDLEADPDLFLDASAAGVEYGGEKKKKARQNRIFVHH